MNLVAKAFENITDQQVVAFKVKTSIQRMDSTQIASNILDMSRLQLLVEGIQRMQRVLSETNSRPMRSGWASTSRAARGNMSTT